MMCEFYILRGMLKGTSLGEATSNNEKIKPVALRVRRHQAGRQLVSQQKIPLDNILCSNLFRVVLKALWTWPYLTDTARLAL